jgi:hypothetical protein
MGNAISWRLGLRRERGHLRQVIALDGNALVRGFRHDAILVIDSDGETLAERHRRNHKPEIDTFFRSRPKGNRFGAGQGDFRRSIRGHLD